MNPRIAKDIQLVKLPLVSGIVLMIGGFFIAPPMSLFAWMLASAIVVASVYVGDMTSNGLFLPMTLPVPRMRLWREKTMVAALALLVLSLVYVTTYFAGGYQVVTPLIDVLFVISLPVFILGVGAAIGLWTRQAIATFWLVILLGGCLFIFSSVAVPWVLPDANIFFVLCALFLVGGIWGLWIASRRFSRFEDTGDYGALGHIELGAFSAGNGDRRTHAIGLRKLAVLARKEIVLQQINIVLTAGIVAVIGVVALTVSQNLLMKIVWLPKLIALLIAFVVGAVAFAEEERMGISSWILTLPAKRRTQFIVKLTVSIIGALALSFVAVMALDAMMAAHAVSNQFTPIYRLTASHFVLLAVLAPLAACLGGGFASSFSRNFLAALSQCLLTGMVLFGLYKWFDSFLLWLVPNEFRVAPDALLVITGGPALFFVFVWGCWRNFVRESTRSKAVSSYVKLVMVLVAVMMFDSLIFIRAWELFEPNPASARFAKEPQGGFALPRPVLTGDGYHAILRDRSLWRIQYYAGNPRVGVVEYGNYRIGSGNDWKDVVGRGNGMFALKTDGSMWMQGEFYARNIKLRSDGTKRNGFHDIGWDTITVFRPREVAPGTKWKNLSSGFQHGETIAIRDDGTLWMWGQTSTNVFNVDLDGPVQMTQLSTDTDWKGVVNRVALKEDGSLWVLDGRSFSALGIGKDTLEWGAVEVEMDVKFTELVPARTDRFNSVIVGRTTDGGVLLLGHPYFYNEWNIGCDDAVGVPIEPIGLAIDMPWFRQADTVLTPDNVVLARSPELDFGCAWVAMGSEGGFTRDGSYWDLRHGRGSALDFIAEWLHLSLRADEVPQLIPPRWRPKLVGKLDDLSGN